MPSIVAELNELLDDDRDDDKESTLRQEDRIRCYNIAQLRGLHRQLEIQSEGMHDSVLRSANRLLMEKINKELAQREALLVIEQARQMEDIERDRKREEEEAFKKKEKRAVQKMLVIQANYRANKEIRAEETEHYIQERTQVVRRRIRAMTKRNILYGIALALFITAAGVTGWNWKVGGIYAIPLVIASLFFYIMGRVVGERWHIKVTAEKDLLVKIEDREALILKDLKESYKKIVEEEKKKRAEERRERKRKRQERLAKEEAERKAAEEDILKEMEEGVKRAMQQAALEAQPSLETQGSDVSDRDSDLSARESDVEEDGEGQQGRRKDGVGASGQEETKEEYDRPGSKTSPPGVPPPPIGS